MGAGSSKLVFGDYDLTNYAQTGATDADIVWIPTATENKQMWALSAESIRFPGSPDVINAQAQSNFIVVDSGTSFADADMEDFQNLVRMLLDHDVSCKQQENVNDFYHCLCATALCTEAPDLEFSVKTSSG